MTLNKLPLLQSFHSHLANPLSTEPAPTFICSRQTAGKMVLQEAWLHCDFPLLSRSEMFYPIEVGQWGPASLSWSSGKAENMWLAHFRHFLFLCNEKKVVRVTIIFIHHFTCISHYYNSLGLSVMQANIIIAPSITVLKVHRCTWERSLRLLEALHEKVQYRKTGLKSSRSLISRQWL